jgi:hypothetical protein
MMKFRVLPQSLLSESDFDEFPVWSEFYDYDELEDIERWGLDRDEVLRLFRDNSPGNEHCVYTLLESNPFPERMRVFIRASIITASGRRLKGYVMDENAFCLGVFFNGAEFIFSRHPMLATENGTREQSLQTALEAAEIIFPVTYETNFQCKSGKRIAGEFSYGTSKK